MDVTLYRPLTAESDWPFFDPDCTISESNKALVFPLALGAARRFWDEYVSPKPLERHPMLLPKGHWLAPAVSGPSWLRGQSQGALVRSEPADLESFLNTNFHLASGERTYFVLMRELVYSVPIGLFTRHYEDFLLLGDEGPFLYHPESGAFACFGPNGQLSFGVRSNTSLPAA